ncbi:MAG: histidine kinase [Hungatella sp.]|nr:histidine kinase [Hungatella sp.]
MNKNGNSIKSRLCLIALLQCVLVVIFWLYLTISEAMMLINNTASQSYQNGEKILTQLENDLAVLSRTTLFPTNQALFAHDDTLCSFLRKGPILENHTFGFTFYNQAQTQMNNSPIDFIAIYDMEGNGVYLTKKDSAYRSCTIRQNADWYESLLNGPLGAASILKPDEFIHSGIAEKDKISVCVVRNLVDPYHYRTIGLCVAGRDVSSIIQGISFEHSLPAQEYAIYYDGKLLLTNMEAPSMPAYHEKPEGQIRLDIKKPGLEHSLFHGKNTAIVIQTPFASIFRQLIPARILVIAAWAGILVLISLTMFRVIRNIQTPLKALVTTCNAFETDYVPALPSLPLPLEFNEVFLSFNHMSDRINTLIHEILMKDLEKQETELQLLRTQINPHYLYNTLEVIHLAAYKNGDFHVAEMAELLGKNLQYGLRGTTKEVTLREELEQLDVYLSILSHQYKDRILFNKVLSPELLDCRTIKLIFQPMVENSILHGFDNTKQHMIIDILGYKKDSQMILCVSDNGCGMPPQELKKVQQELLNPASQSIGIRNVSRRIQLTYGSEYGLSIDSIEGQGSTVIVTLPCLPFNFSQQ